MKVDTIEQFKILKFLEDNFQIDEITMELYNEKCIRIVDANGQEGYFEYQDGKVILLPF